ncbi:MULTISPECIES: helix-turn-helix domain-containing protein [unclassified Chryseobacterium]|uniref:helix-turn-helix domain-containing protein n=1 Tax=unclassified Chryseobacterium TaxID=2593645 RepID=UPI000ACD3D27|nr:MULTISPECIES: helix-turn-helix domain-containing protein [unclassified Chryseobacterium]
MTKVPFEEIPSMLLVIKETQQSIQKQLADWQNAVSQNLQTTQKEFLTNEETANFLSIDRTTLWKWEKKGLILSCQIEGRKYYKYEDIRNLLNSTQRKS